MARMFAASSPHCWPSSWARSVVRAQIPNLTAPAPSTKDAEAEKSKKAVATAEGRITVKARVSDRELEGFLTRFLPKYPGVARWAFPSMPGSSRSTATSTTTTRSTTSPPFTEKVEGVRLVLNKMKTDAEILTGRQMAMKVLGEYATIFARRTGSWRSWRSASSSASALWPGSSPRSPRRCSRRSSATPLLRSVVGSILSTLIVLGGHPAGALGAEPDARGGLGPGAGGRGRPGPGVRVPRHRRELHRLDAPGRPPAVPDRRLHHRRRASRARSSR